MGKGKKYLMDKGGGMKKLLMLALVFFAFDRFIIYKIRETQKSFALGREKDDSKKLRVAGRLIKWSETNKRSAA